MRRPFAISTGALMLALLPAALVAQTPPAQQPTGQQPPAQQPPTQQPAQPADPAAQQPAEKPSEPKLAFKGQAGLMLVQVKPDQTAAFEEMSAKLKSALTAATDPALKAHATSWKIYKAAEPMQGNALYVIVVDPATPGIEYNPLDILSKTMTPQQLGDPATQEMFKRFAAAFAGVNILNLAAVGGGGM